jgi:hypothetical protein
MSEQRSVEAVNCARPERNVGASRALIGAQSLPPADIAPRLSSMAQAIIAPTSRRPRLALARRGGGQAPRADERQSLAMIFGTVWRHRKSPRSPDAHCAEKRMRMGFDQRERAVVERAASARVVFRRDRRARAVGRA